MSARPFRPRHAGSSSKHLPAHQVTTTFELGWNNLKNGELLQKAEENGFSVVVTTDQNLRYQQNLMDRKIAIVVLTTTSWPRIERGYIFLRLGPEPRRALRGLEN